MWWDRSKEVPGLYSRTRIEKFWSRPSCVIHQMFPITNTYSDYSHASGQTSKHPGCEPERVLTPSESIGSHMWGNTLCLLILGANMSTLFVLPVILFGRNVITNVKWSHHHRFHHVTRWLNTCDNAICTKFTEGCKSCKTVYSRQRFNFVLKQKYRFL